MLESAGMLGKRSPFVANLSRAHHRYLSQSSSRLVGAAVSLLALLLFLSTLQLTINGGSGPYLTDVGEIQNALPRWGTIHFTGYPLYTALGSLFVNGLQLLGVAPALSAGLYSALWGAVSVGLLAWLMMLLDVPTAAAALASLLFALATSMWVDASIAELHTMTMALIFASLLAGVRFHRSGRSSDLYWLAFLAGQGIAHQRAFAFLAPALLLLVLPHWRFLHKRWLPVLGLALLGPLTYLYLPLVDWLGSPWVFSAPGSWEGFWALVLDTKAERIISMPESAAALWSRSAGVVSLLNDDWPWPLWLTGLLGLGLLGRALRRERAALTLTWLVYLLLSIVVWEGYVSDALLAVKLPIIAMASVGLGFLAQSLRERRVAYQLLLAGGAATALFLAVTHRPAIVAITRAPAPAATISMVQRIPRPPDGRPVTLMALWGNDYWQLAYAQRYQGRFPWLNLVDHNADFRAILARGDHLYTLSQTLYARPLQWWEERLQARVSLDSVTPHVLEIKPAPDLAPANNDSPRLAWENGVAIRDAQLVWEDDTTLVLSLTWETQHSIAHDYSVAVHLVNSDPPTAADDILAQADRAHPVDGWYPTTRWQPQEMVRDHYQLDVEPSMMPVAVRVSMYRPLADGLENTSWLSLPVPPRPNAN